MSVLRIVRLRITNYRGVECLDHPVPEAGMIVSGPNAAGKTSVLRAIRAALAARDIGEDAIRHGETRAEILVDLGALSVKRTITAEGSKVVVMQDGKIVLKPQAALTELLGTSAIDPLELFLEKDSKKRRSLILAALPIRVTIEDLERWIPADWQNTPLLEPALKMHGLEACSTLRKHFFDLRAAINVSMKTIGGYVTTLEDELAKHGGRVFPNAMTVDVARAEEMAATVSLATLNSEIAASVKAEERCASGRERIAELREKERASRKAAVEMRVSKECLQGLLENFDRLSTEIGKLQHEQALFTGQIEKAQAVNHRADGLETFADGQASQLLDLESQLAAMLPRTPTSQELDDATRAADVAKTRHLEAVAAASAQQVRERLADARKQARDAEEKAGRLTSLVTTFTHDAPKELLACYAGIEGLGVSGDDITMNGVGMDTLSGAEQMRFAIEIARRANAKTKLLIVDGLERLDADHFEQFLRESTRDGYQLIGTKVAGGEVQMLAISQEEAEKK